MNAGPYSPPPADTPPPSAPQDVPGEPQPYPSPAPEAPAPGYYPPPTEAGGPPPRAPRSMGPLIAGLVIVVVLIAAIGGYIVGGLAFAQSRLSNAHSAYNTVVGHQNSLTDTVNSAQNQLKALDVSSSSTTAADIQKYKTTWAGVVSKAQAAQPQIESDDATLATADSGLHDNSWLTVLSRSELDKESAKLGHERKALAAARVLVADYIQVGAFYQAFADVLMDFDTLGTKLQASDLAGAAAADEKLKTDAAKAISLDKAPGMPPEMDQLLHYISAMGTDFTNLINAAAQKNDAAFTAAESALQADATKVEGFDFNKLDTDINNYYNPLIDAYNSEVDKANAG